jgi:hypothetical protein
LFARKYLQKEKASAPLKGRTLAVPPLFPPETGGHSAAVNGASRFRLHRIPSAEQLQSYLPHLFLQGAFQPVSPSLWENDGAYSSFSLFFAVSTMLLYHKILFSFAKFVNSFL